MQPPPPSPCLLDQLRARLRYRHHSLATEKLYVYWARFFVRFHGSRHPKDMGGAEVEAFLSHLANERQVAPSTHKQALAAILFLYREVLQIDLPWMKEIGRPRTQHRIPVVLTVPEVQQTLALLEAGHLVHGLLARLLYGTGMRIMEARLRVKDVDFDDGATVVREDEGGTSAAPWHRHPHGAGTVRPHRRAHRHAPPPCAEDRRWGGSLLDVLSPMAATGAPSREALEHLNAMPL